MFFTDASDDDRDGGEIRAWAWDFGDPASGAANASTDVNPSHTYAQPGNYRVTLTVTDDRGLSATSSQVLTVAP